MSLFYSFSRQSLRLLFTLLSRHKSYLPEEGIYPGGAIIAANHASHFDPPLIAISWPEPIHFLARKSLFDVPLLRPVITRLNAHPLGGKHDLSSLKLACRLLQEGKKILVFPEGTRSTDGEISEFKNGISLLAKRSGCPVIPTYIHGSFDLWPRSRALPRLCGKRTACVFGKPIWFQPENEENQELFADRIKQEIELLREKY
ncbi:MAG: 1-acyl-sn-glycerol-3-phosphate acyltransferase [Verrucomicrobia bacterium]|nr:1-acyl-sn-glycerol-3-phosphate acyltransferase [Verrucomicrobiota bacterium]